jgi:hypothetical protein
MAIDKRDTAALMRRLDRPVYRPAEPNLDVISIKYPRADTTTSNYRQSSRRTFNLAVGQAPVYFAT